MTVDRLVQIKSGVAGYEFSDSSQAIWIRALISGDYEYRGEQIAITPEYIQLVASETRRALKRWRDLAELDAEPYRPPVLIEHQRAGGKRGEVLDLKVKQIEATEDQEARTELWLKLLPSWETHWLIQDEAFEFVSVKVVPAYRDQDGEEYQLLLEEVSLTVNPFFKHLGRIKESMTHEMSDQTIKELAHIFSGHTAEGEDVADEKLMGKMADLETRLAALEQKPKTEQEAKQPAQPQTVQASAAQAEPEWVTKHIAALNANTLAIIASAGGAQTEIGGRSAAQPPAPAAQYKTLMEAIKGIQASDGVDEEEAARISMTRYPHLF